MDIYTKGFPITQTLTLLNGAALADTSEYSSIAMRIRRLGDDVLLTTLSLAAGTIIQTPEYPSTSGKITFTLSAADIADAKAGTYECEIGKKIPGESREREVVYLFILEEAYS